MRNGLPGCHRATLMIVSDSKHFSEESLFLPSGGSGTAVLYVLSVFRFFALRAKKRKTDKT
jgi:hypothetical protein